MEQNEKISLVLIGAVIGAVFCFINVLWWNTSNFQVSVYQTKQEILQLPNGTTWKKIRTAKELESRN